MSQARTTELTPADTPPEPGVHLVVVHGQNMNTHVRRRTPPGPNRIRVDYQILREYVNNHLAQYMEPSDSVLLTFYLDRPNANPDPINFSTFVETLQSIGYEVFLTPAGPRSTPELRNNITALVRDKVHGNPPLVSLTYVAGDSKDFMIIVNDLELVKLAAEEDVPMTLIGLEEECQPVTSRNDDAIAFIDLEDIDGMFDTPLGKRGAWRLPGRGGWVPRRPSM